MTVAQGDPGDEEDRADMGPCQVIGIVCTDGNASQPCGSYKSWSVFRFFAIISSIQ